MPDGGAYQSQKMRALLFRTAKMKKQVCPLAKVYQLIEPGPVVLVSTSCSGQSNIMTMSWHMMIEFVPPLIGCVISNRNYSFELLKKSKECVINIPSVDLIDEVVSVGNTTGAKVDKFKKFGLTAEPAAFVKAPLIAECFANLECKVIDTSMTSRYGIFILEVLQAWMTTSKRRQRMIHHCGEGNFVVDGKKVKLLSHKM
jgi:flavin reductase (DIM6/NTAB) family NADH-FMN oxidoreductase RutF